MHLEVHTNLHQTNHHCHLPGLISFKWWKNAAFAKNHHSWNDLLAVAKTHRLSIIFI
jgi:hypothetical protein